MTRESTAQSVKTTTVTERTTRGLREVLFSEIDMLRDGVIEPGRAQATAKLAQQIITSVNLELTAVRILEDREGNGQRTIPTLSLVK